MIEDLINYIASKGLYVDYYVKEKEDLTSIDITKFMNNSFDADSISLLLDEGKFVEIIYKFGDIKVIDNSIDLKLLNVISNENQIKILVPKKSNLKLPYDINKNIHMHRELTQLDNLKRGLGFVSSKARRNLIVNSFVKGRIVTKVSGDFVNEQYYLYNGKKFLEVENANEDFTIIIREYKDGSIAVYRKLFFGTEVLFDGNYDLEILDISSIIILSLIYKKFDSLINFEVKKTEIESYLSNCLYDLRERATYLDGLGLEIIESMIKYNEEGFTNIYKKTIPPVDWIERALFSMKEKFDKFTLVDLLKLTEIDEGEVLINCFDI